MTTNTSSVTTANAASLAVQDTPVVIYSGTKGIFLGRGPSGDLHWTGDDVIVSGAAICYPTIDHAVCAAQEIGISHRQDLLLCRVTPDIEEANGARFASVQACIDAMLPAWLSPWTIEKERSKTYRSVALH